MRLRLNFEGSHVSGVGVDDVGFFTFAGTHTTSNICMTKTYGRAGLKGTLLSHFAATPEELADLTRCWRESADHTVEYRGWYQDRGITGSWRIPLNCSGEFRLWPVKQESGTPA